MLRGPSFPARRVGATIASAPCPPALGSHNALKTLWRRKKEGNLPRLFSIDCAHSLCMGNCVWCHPGPGTFILYHLLLPQEPRAGRREAAGPRPSQCSPSIQVIDHPVNYIDNRGCEGPGSLGEGHRHYCLVGSSFTTSQQLL